MKCRTCGNEMEIRQTDTGKIAICHHCKVKRKLVKKSEQQPVRTPAAQTYSNIPERAVREKAEREVRANYDNMIAAGGQSRPKNTSRSGNVKQAAGKNTRRKKKQRTRMITIMITIIVIALLVVLGYFGFRFIRDRFFSSDSNSSTAAEDTGTDGGNTAAKDDGSGDSINVSTDTFAVEYLRHETAEDVNGAQCLLVYYTFTNKQKDAPASALTTILLTASQNDTDCTTATMAESSEETINGLLTVENGESLTICQSFTITDTSDVTLKISDLLSTDQSSLGEQVITL